MPAVLLAVVAIGLWLYLLAEVIRAPDDAWFRSGTRMIWVVLMAVIPVFGTLLYLAIGRPWPASRDDRPLDDRLPGASD